MTMQKCAYGGNGNGSITGYSQVRKYLDLIGTIHLHTINDSPTETKNRKIVK